MCNARIASHNRLKYEILKTSYQICTNLVRLARLQKEFWEIEMNETSPSDSLTIKKSTIKEVVFHAVWLLVSLGIIYAGAKDIVTEPTIGKAMPVMIISMIAVAGFYLKIRELFFGRDRS